MREKRSQGRSLKVQKKAAVRASITFPPGLYENLGDIAKHKNVSLAWVARHASGKRAADQTPAMRGKQALGANRRWL